MAQAELDLIWGVPSSRMLGNTGVTDPDWIPLDLIEGSGLTIVRENGHTAWIPANPTLKNDGVRADSALETGTAILAGAYANVVETMQLYLTGQTYQMRSAALARLYRMSEAALNFQTGVTSQPVYLRWQPQVEDGTPALPQYATVIKIDVSFVEHDLMHTDEAPEVTVSIEREPFWRALPPMDNPKKWAFHSRGLIPTNSGSPAATEYNYTHLDLLSVFGGAASYRSLFQQNVWAYDEIGTNNINYVDIPAASLPGDAPALALVNFTTQAANIAGIWVARTTQPDYYPGNNNNATTQRARCTFNGNDSTITGVSIAGTKPIIATGLFGNGSIVTRSVLELAYPAGAASESVANWTRVYAQYQNKYMAFVRAQMTAGVITEVTLNLIWRSGALNSNVERTTPVQLRQTAFGLTYLGVVELNKTQRRMGALNGTGVDATSTFQLQLGSSKTAGAVATVRVWDIILLPFDEAASLALISDTLLASGDPVLIDKTGYFGMDDGAVARQSGELLTRQMRGQAIELVPNVNNRLYFLPDMNAPNVTTAHQARIDIVPCWYGVRDK